MDAVARKELWENMDTVHAMSDDATRQHFVFVVDTLRRHRDDDAMWDVVTGWTNKHV